MGLVARRIIYLDAGATGWGDGADAISEVCIHAIADNI